VQLVWGALMAGLRAGRVTNEWPLMNGSFWPGVSQTGRGFWGTVSADPSVVHFIHRWWAWAVVGLLIVLARRVKAAGGRRAAIAIHSAFGTQILLGIGTVMSDVALPMAVLHQLVGALLVGTVAWGAHVVGRRA
jgi:cytochrome c oxidase assembly protein subunit 15